MLALVGDFISHTGDIAGPLTFAADIATKNKLPLWGKVAVKCTATLFGGLSSVANMRTCKNNILKHNLEKETEARSQNKMNSP